MQMCGLVTSKTRL